MSHAAETRRHADQLMKRLDAAPRLTASPEAILWARKGENETVGEERGESILVECFMAAPSTQAFRRIHQS
jgi:hypothetical protein